MSAILLPITTDVAPAPGRVFRALTGYNLRPWQRETLERWIDGGADAWGGSCTVPTGLGKSMLPILAFVASAYVVQPPRRIVYVVNRRIVVDQTYTIADRVKVRLSHASSADGEDRDVLLTFKAMLISKMHLDQRVLKNEAREFPQIHLLRGGTGDRLLQLTSPVVPTIIVSTIDQAGSRLLLRGYGVSQRVWPIQGGLLAYDTIWIVDEAHTACPFVTTLRRVREEIIASPGASELGRPLVLLEATATSGRATNPFIPQDADEARIAGASKNVRIEISAEAPARDGLATRATAFVTEALDDPNCARVAIVCNTINDARSVFARIDRDLPTYARSARALLLIGAIRTKDRELLHASDTFKDLDADRRPSDPVIVVATQTVETGPDFDFDYLMSDVAAIDALIQRFGRENRRGTSPSPHGLIWGFPNVSPVYGSAPIATAGLLQAWGPQVDFSPLDIVARLHKVDERVLAQALTPVKHAEALMGVRVRDLGRTWPRNREDTPVAWYLHGERSGEVKVIWRDDIGSLLDGTERGDKAQGLAETYVDILPPAAPESLTISTRAARALLRNNLKSDISDTDDGDAQDDKGEGQGNERRAIAIRNDDVVIIKARDVLAGDTLIVPVSYGWCDRYGLSPGEMKAVDSIADENRIILSSDVVPPRDEEEPSDPWQERAIAALQGILGTSTDEILRTFAERMAKAASIALTQHPTRSMFFVLRLVERFGCDQFDDSGSRRNVSLVDHSVHVRDRCAAYATSLGFDEPLGEALALAGEAHDLGKVHIRFQQERLGNYGDEMLAKSRKGQVEVRLSYRHECGSAAMVKNETPLVRHLVGSHHGYGRPGFPSQSDRPLRLAFEQLGKSWNAEVIEDLDRLGSWWREQFATLQVQYSPWGLAYLEALLRLADHRASEAERIGEG